MLYRSELICLKKNVMNNIYLINSLLCILILPFKAVTQENLVQENIFVVFDSSEFEKYKNRPNEEDIFGEYFFMVPEHKEDPSDIYNKGLINLVDKKYKDFEAKFSDDPLPKFRVNKSFLRKNKKEILTIKKMRQLGFNKVFNMFLNAKHIFLIDKSETRDCKILIKEVQLFYIGEE